MQAVLLQRLRLLPENEWTCQLCGVKLFVLLFVLEVLGHVTLKEKHVELVLLLSLRHAQSDPERQRDLGTFHGLQVCEKFNLWQAFDFLQGQHAAAFDQVDAALQDPSRSGDHWGGSLG